MRKIFIGVVCIVMLFPVAVFANDETQPEREPETIEATDIEAEDLCDLCDDIQVEEAPEEEGDLDEILDETEETDKEDERDESLADDELSAEKPESFEEESDFSEESATAPDEDESEEPLEENGDTEVDQTDITTSGEEECPLSFEVEAITLEEASSSDEPVIETLDNEHDHLCSNEEDSPDEESSMVKEKGEAILLPCLEIAASRVQAAIRSGEAKTDIGDLDIGEESEMLLLDALMDIPETYEDIEEFGLINEGGIITAVYFIYPVKETEEAAPVVLYPTKETEEATPVVLSAQDKPISSASKANEETVFDEKSRLIVTPVETKKTEHLLIKAPGRNEDEKHQSSHPSSFLEIVAWFLAVVIRVISKGGVTI